MSEQWLSIVEYARRNDISDMTVRRRIKKGKLEAVLKDGKYFIPITHELSHRSFSMEPAHTQVAMPTPTSRPVVRPRQIERQDVVSPMQRQAEASRSFDQGSVTQIESTLKSVVDTRANAVARQPNVNLDSLKYLSKSVLHEIQNDKKSIISTQHLLEYCDSLVASIDEQKKLLAQKFEAERVSYLHEIKALQLENEKNQQQIEDLHVLVKLLEQKKS